MQSKQFDATLLDCSLSVPLAEPSTPKAMRSPPEAEPVISASKLEDTNDEKMFCMGHGIAH